MCTRSTASVVMALFLAAFGLIMGPIFWAVMNPPSHHVYSSHNYTTTPTNHSNCSCPPLNVSSFSLATAAATAAAPITKYNADGKARDCAQLAGVDINSAPYDLWTTAESYPKIFLPYPLAKFEVSTIDYLVSPKDATCLARSHWISQVLTPVLARIEHIIQAQYEAGTKYLVLPSYSTVLNPYIMGQMSYACLGLAGEDSMTASSFPGLFSGRTLEQRFPGQHFIVLNPSAPAVEKVASGMIVRLYDVHSGSDPTLVRANILAALGIPVASASNSVAYPLVWLVQAHDDASVTAGKTYTEAAASIGLFSTTIAIDFDADTGMFTLASLQSAATQLATLHSSATKMIVGIAVNGGLGDQFSSDATAEESFFPRLLASTAGASKIHFLGINYGMAAVSVPVDIDMGISTSQPTITPELEYVGVPTDPFQLLSIPGSLGYLDLIKWVSLCHEKRSLPVPTMWSVTGQPWTFHNNTNTLSSMWLQRTLVPANSLFYAFPDRNFLVNRLVTGHDEQGAVPY